MSIKITDYLANLEEEKITKRWDYLHRYKLLYVNDKNGQPPYLQTKNHVKKIYLPHSNQRLWVKRMVDHDKKKIEDMSIINEILFSRIYNALGVNAINYYPCFFQNPKEQKKKSSRKIIGVCSQDLKSVEGLDVEFIGEKYRQDFTWLFNHSLLGMVKNRQKFIDTEFKTNLNAELFYDRIVVTYILDLIFLLADNHMGNKFAIGKKNNGNEDLVSFDFEDNNINYSGFYKFKEGFENCIIGKTRFHARCECESLRERLQFIKYLYWSGKLPNECMVLFEKLKEFDLDKLIRETEAETGYPITKSKQTDRIRRLVDYNQEFMIK